MQRLARLRQESRARTGQTSSGDRRSLLLLSPPASRTNSPQLAPCGCNAAAVMNHGDDQPPPATQKPVKQTLCGSLRRDTHWKCLLLSILIWGCLVAIAWCRLTQIHRQVYSRYNVVAVRSSPASPCQDGYIYIPVAFVVMLYLVYLVECWHCHTRIQLQSKVNISTVYDHLHALHHAAPLVWWKAVCYHYVRRTRQVTRYRNGDAFTSTQVFYERVNSHTATCAFNFANCGTQDMSKKLVNLEDYPTTKIRFTKGLSFATLDAEQEFEEQRSHFFQQYERQDDYMETREGMDLLNVNFKEYLVAFSDRHRLPWYISHAVFWIASAWLFSWPLRVLIEYKTAYVHVHIHKTFGCNYMDSVGGMTRVSTMGSSELQSPSNYTLVPSYSEAVLMDCASNVSQVANSNVNSLTAIPIVSMPENGYANGHRPSRTLIVSNGQIPNGHAEGASSGGRAAAFLRRLGLGASSDNLHPKPQKKKKKGKRRRHSFTGQPGRAMRHSDSDGVMRYAVQQSRPLFNSTTPSPSSLVDLQTVTSCGGACCEPRYTPAPTRSTVAPPYHNPICEHASPYRRRETAPLRSQQPRREQGYGSVQYNHSTEEVHLPPDQPPCYEEAMGLAISLPIGHGPCCSAAGGPHVEAIPIGPPVVSSVDDNSENDTNPLYEMIETTL